MSRAAGVGPGARRRPIHLGAGLVGERGQRAPRAGGRPASVVTGETLADASAVRARAVPGGERYKATDTCAEIRSVPVGRRTGRDPA